MKKEDLKYIQKELGFTVQQMADSLNVNKRTYEYWLYGPIEVPELYELTLKGMMLIIDNDNTALLKEYIEEGLIQLVHQSFYALWSDKNKYTQIWEVHSTKLFVEPRS